MIQLCRFATLAKTTSNKIASQVLSAPPIVLGTSKTKSGITVATVDDLGPVSTLSVVIGAGSRNETDSTHGVAHFLKRALIRNVPGDSIVRTIKETELRGDTLYTSHGREHISITSDFLRDDLVDVAPLLLSQVFNASFQPFEFIRAKELVSDETHAAMQDPSLKVYDALHHIAFRNGLGNSLFASDEALDLLKRADLSDFAVKHFTADKIAIVGSGVSHEELLKIVESSTASINIPLSSDKSSKSRYYGGEIRIDGGPSGEAIYAIAYPSPSLSSPDYPTSLILEALLDGSRRVSHGCLSGHLGSISTDSTVAKSFAFHHSDAGLLGFYIKGSNSEVTSVASKAIDTLKSIAANGVEAEALQKAKKSAVLEYDDSNRDERIESIAKQVLSLGKVKTVQDISLAINKVNAKDVQKFAQELIKSKPSVVAFGNLRLLPFLDQLK